MKTFKKLAILRFDGRNKKVTIASEWKFKKPICEDMAHQMVKDYVKKNKIKFYCYDLLDQVYE